MSLQQSMAKFIKTFDPQPVRCHWCKQFLSKKLAKATVREPETFYCFSCYQKGLDEEYEAMGMYEQCRETA